MKKNTAQNAEQPEKNLEFSEFKNYTQNDYDCDIIARIIQEEIDNEIIRLISAMILEKDKKH